jgi:DNA repair and recombination protein RAD54 and RAD54-like protein
MKKASSSDNVTIERVALFDFLEIPDHLKQSFIVPSGVKITAESIKLRAIKTLGPPKVFREIKPGCWGPPLPFVCFPPSTSSPDEGDMESEELPTSITHERLILWRDESDSTNTIEVVAELASKLRPHQREGVQFLFECTMGLRGFEGEGCILADDMGLGKTLMSITLMWTLLNQGMSSSGSAVKKVMVVCPTSLVGNWDNEIRKWLAGKCPTFPVKSEPKKVIRNFVQARGKGVLIISYETQRRYADLLQPKSASMLGGGSTIDMIICDEAHKLKNADAGTTKALMALTAKKRILLSGTPMQNELTEFYNMVNFCNPNCLGSATTFRKKYERPILASREIDADETEVREAGRLQKELSTIVNEFILKRGNILNARHLPPKLTQIVCCRLTPLQDRLYDFLLQQKEIRHARDGLNENTLNSIRHMLNICSHPKQILDAYKLKSAKGAADEELKQLSELILQDEEFCQGSANIAALKMKPSTNSGGGGGSSSSSLNSLANRRSRGGESASSVSSVDPEQSGKMLVLFRLMQSLRAMNEGDRIVVVSNYTQTLDVIGTMCKDNRWPTLRLDGSTNLNKRTKLVDDFNDPGSGAFVFLLSSKAGGCGINLIGGNRLVLFDPDWNPASDKQAAGRIWREGQKKRCFIYRFASTSTIEEKIMQRQLSKEGLQNVVEDKDQTNAFSTDELKTLFIRRKDTVSDTHDALRCKRCSSVKTYSVTAQAKRKLSDWQIQECGEFLDDFSKTITEKLVAMEIPSSLISEHLVFLKSRLVDKQFATLPLFSRALRQIMAEIDSEQILIDKGISLMPDFLDKWSDLVPQLAHSDEPVVDSRIPSKTANEDEHVAQIGCPDDDDLNQWSHHCDVSSTDDEALKRAMSDDNAISFVYGLEINWDLLQLREAGRCEEEVQRKESAKMELEQLNLKRAQLKLRKNDDEAAAAAAADAATGDGDGKDHTAQRTVDTNIGIVTENGDATDNPTLSKSKRKKKDKEDKGSKKSKSKSENKAKKMRIVLSDDETVVDENVINHQHFKSFGTMHKICDDVGDDEMFTGILLEKSDSETYDGYTSKTINLLDRSSDVVIEKNNGHVAVGNIAEYDVSAASTQKSASTQKILKSHNVEDVAISQEQEKTEWNCTSCTLLNKISESFCSVCSEKMPDKLRREIRKRKKGSLLQATCALNGLNGGGK